jgi:hypothetical protein
LEALKSENREKSAALLQQAYDKIESSDSKGKLHPSPPPPTLHNKQARSTINAFKSGREREGECFVEQTAPFNTLLFFLGHTLSVCLKADLRHLMEELERGDMNTARKSLQDSLTSHWQEKGGRASCYVTRKEDKLITLFTS